MDRCHVAALEEQGETRPFLSCSCPQQVRRIVPPCSGMGMGEGDRVAGAFPTQGTWVVPGPQAGRGNCNELISAAANSLLSGGAGVQCGVSSVFQKSIQVASP